jgi:hypothetical protein
MQAPFRTLMFCNAEPRDPNSLRVQEVDELGTLNYNSARTLFFGDSVSCIPARPSWNGYENLNETGRLSNVMQFRVMESGQMCWPAAWSTGFGADARRQAFRRAGHLPSHLRFRALG